MLVEGASSRQQPVSLVGEAMSTGGGTERVSC